MKETSYERRENNDAKKEVSRGRNINGSKTNQEKE